MNNIRERRMELGITQEDLAAMLREVDPRIDAPMVSRFESEVCFPSPRVLTRMESGLQATRSDLYDELAEYVIEHTESLYNPNTAVIAALIPFGSENAISREELAMKYGESDRTTRKAVNQARMDGLPICNEQNGRGYYQSEDAAELERQYKSVRARGLNLMRQASILKSKIDEVKK